MTMAAASRLEVDTAIVGSGFAGSLAALALARRGRRVALVEQGRHPRFAIGESSTPLANLLLEDLADRYDLVELRPFCKWGTWQRVRPEIPVGLKRGFAFFFHRPDAELRADPDRARQLFVAASPHDAVGDTHWFREAFDRELVAQAQAAGCMYFDETRLLRARATPSAVMLEGERAGRPIAVSAKFVVDASGPRGFLHGALGLDERPLAWLPPTEGLFTHFAHVARWEDVAPPTGRPPFSPDQAALHHVFPDGWIWVLRFNNGITSAGAALTRAAAAAQGLSEGARSWDRLVARLPSVREQFRAAEPVRPFVHASRLAFRSRQVSGERWALLPSAVGTIDPLLSTGIPLTLLGLVQLLDIVESTAEGPERARRLQEYGRAIQGGLDTTEQLVSALYGAMDDVPLFKAMSLLYFAAASYSEAARRLGRPELAPGFLLCDDPQFAATIRLAARLGRARSPAARARVLTAIDRAVEPIDIAGLLDRTRRDWYPVVAGDLLSGAPKLQASTGEIQRLLERCGMAPATSRPASPTVPR